MRTEEEKLSNWHGLALSMRTINCFRNHNIENIEQLTNMTQADFLRWSNFGRKSLKDLEYQLAKKRLNIARDVRDPRHAPEGEKLYNEYIEAKGKWELFREQYYVNELRRQLAELKTNPLADS